MQAGQINFKGLVMKVLMNLEHWVKYNTPIKRCGKSTFQTDWETPLILSLLNILKYNVPPFKGLAMKVLIILKHLVKYNTPIKRCGKSTNRLGNSKNTLTFKYTQIKCTSIYYSSNTNVRGFRYTVFHTIYSKRL